MHQHLIKTLILTTNTGHDILLMNYRALLEFKHIYMNLMVQNDILAHDTIWAFTDQLLSITTRLEGRLNWACYLWKKKRRIWWATRSVRNLSMTDALNVDITKLIRSYLRTKHNPIIVSSSSNKINVKMIFNANNNNSQEEPLTEHYITLHNSIISTLQSVTQTWPLYHESIW